MQLKNQSTQEEYYLSIASSTTISKKENKYSIHIMLFDNIIFQKLIKNLIAKKKSSIQLIIDSKEDDTLGSIDYRFGYDRAGSGYKIRELKKIVFDLSILDQEIVLDFDIYASRVFFECNDTPTDDDLSEFHKNYIFRVPFKLVPELFNLKHKERSFFLKDSDKSYIKYNQMEKIKNKYGRVLYIFQDNQLDHFLVDIPFLTISRIAKGYQKISEFIDDKDAPEYVRNTGYNVRSHLLSFNHIKTILINSFDKKFIKLPLKATYEGENLGKLFYSYGTNINEENKAERIIEKIIFFINIYNGELSIKIEVLAAPINEIDLKRALTAIEKEKHTEQFNIQIPFKYVPELLDMNQEEVALTFPK